MGEHIEKPQQLSKTAAAFCFSGDVGRLCHHIDSTLFTLSVSANEVPTVFGAVHAAELWHAVDWGMQYWTPLWYAWYAASGMTGALEGSSKYLEPDDTFKEQLSIS